jgi:hypothetical protein
MATEPAARRGRHPSSRAATWVVVAVAAGALLAACASQGGTRPGAAPAAASPSVSQSYVVYPAPGTAAVERDPSCQLAKNTAVPVAKRSSFAAECDGLLQHATDPVTKPVIQTKPTDPTGQVPGRGVTADLRVDLG